MSEPGPTPPNSPNPSNQQDTITATIIAGPTAGGKSARALDVARARNGVVINADSLQIYRDLPILTAQPSPMPDIPHRLYGILNPNDPMDAMRWRDLAITEIRAAAAQNHHPIIVGGTGFYLKTLMEGLSPIPQIPEFIRLMIEDLKDRMGDEVFYKFVITADPKLEGRMDPKNSRRLVRAYEVLAATGLSITHWQSLPKSGPPQGIKFEIELIMPERAELYHRCNIRFEEMIKQGAIEEVEQFDTKILQGEIAVDAPLTHALGFQPLQSHVRGEMDLETAITLAQNETRHYAKRQATWFRHQLPLFDPPK